MQMAWCITKDYPRFPPIGGQELLIIDTEQLLFEFRIYVQLAAEQSDVRPPDRGDFYVRFPTADAESTTAYDRVDDRPGSWEP